MTQPRPLGEILFEDENIKVVVARGQPCDQPGCAQPQVGLMTYRVWEAGTSLAVEHAFCDHHLRKKLARYTGQLQTFHALRQAGLSEAEANRELTRHLFGRPGPQKPD